VNFPSKYFLIGPDIGIAIRFELFFFLPHYMDTYTFDIYVFLSSLTIQRFGFTVSRKLRC
jgi:hypothetical protein